MLALSIRQPWAWLILNAGKDIENRTWQTKLRGRVLIHAAKGCTKPEYYDAVFWARAALGQPTTGRLDLGIPRPETIDRGGIVGSVEIVDCVTSSASTWWMGPVGFVLRDPRPLPFLPYKGRLSFFDVPEITA